MGNKMQFLLDYDKYINNLGSNLYMDDLELYEQFINQTKNGVLIMSEGLITTHPSDISIGVINKRFKELTANVEPDGEIIIQGHFKELYNYIPLFNNLGYFISTLTIDGNAWISDYNDNTKPIAIYLEAKYDIKISKVNTPNKLYHTSPLKFKHKILKSGLVLKSGNKISIHPNRIYLTDDIETAKMFTTQIPKDKSDYYKDGYIIYEIDTINVDNLYSDVNLRKSGYYTTDNINRRDISINVEVF